MIHQLRLNAIYASVFLVVLSGCQLAKIFRPEEPKNEPTYLSQSNEGPFTSDGNTIADTHALYDLAPDTYDQQRQVAKQYQDGSMPAIPQVNDSFPFDLPVIPRNENGQSVPSQKTNRTPFNSPQFSNSNSATISTASPNNTSRTASPYQTSASRATEPTAYLGQAQPVSPAMGNPGTQSQYAGMPAQNSIPGTGASVGGTKTTQVTIRGVKTNGGPVRVALFDASGGFPKDDSAAFKMVVQPTASTLVQAIPIKIQGPYALAVYQDLNGDRKLNKGSFGVPKEPYGFSRNAAGKYGPPKFSDAALTPGDAVDLTLK